jgi:AcrR family transcriptional regulator
MATSARDRMIRSAALLIRERGVEGTSLSDVLEHSRAPRGSIYHHFPGGKAQLVEEATRYAGEFVGAALAQALANDDLPGAVDGFVAYWRATLRDSDFAAGCPVMAATLEGEAVAGARDAAGAAFARWQELVASMLVRNGIDDDRAQSLATLVVSAVEGAVVLARAQRTTAPLERVAGELRATVRAALA